MRYRGASLQEMLMAAGKMRGCGRSVQSYPEKRSAWERDDDFLKISREFILAKAEEQAARCPQCGVPYCSVHCPLGNHIPDWLKLTAEGRLREAYELSNSTSTMPEVCGRICPQDQIGRASCRERVCQYV